MSAAKGQKVFNEEYAAKQMGISPQTLGRWRREGIVRHYRKLGRLRRYTQEDIDANIAETDAARPQLVTPSSVSEARFG